MVSQAAMGDTVFADDVKVLTPLCLRQPQSK